MKHLSQVMQVTLVGLCLNVFLAGLKLGVGMVVGSAALVADAVHSVSDLATDVIAIVGIRVSSRPADESHAYGHGRFETISASLIGTVLVAGGFAIAWKAGLALYRHEENIPGYAVIIVAAVSIISKEWIYQATQRVARRVGSPALRANAWHHRSDALSSVAVLCGGIAGSVGWGYGDRVAAIVVGLVVAAIGVNAIWKVFVELSEGSISAEESKLIGEAIQGVPGVKGWHRLRTRLVGREVFMDVHVLVDAWLSIDEAHRICSTVERAAAGSLKRPSNVVVHCEPDRGFTDTNGELRSQD